MADNRTAEGRSKNRRVEIEVVGTRSSEPKAPTIPKGLVPVLFGTTRAKTQTNDPYTYFGSVEADGPAEGRLTLGRVLVRVPPVRQRGDIKEPSYVSFAIEKMTRSSVASFIGLSPIAAADPLTDFAFAGPVEEFTPAAFGKSLGQAIDRSKSKSALVYVHGFANSFKDAAFRAAQFTYDLADEKFDVVPVMFSWPSDAQGFNYVAAGDAVWSAGKHLAVFLNQLADSAGVGVIHVVAHSKGAQVLTVALDELRVPNLLAMNGSGPSLVPKFNQIILAAPDIRASDFGTVILPAVASHHRVTNYVSSNDAALRMSKRANAGARAGDAGNGLSLVDGVETIDVTEVNYRAGGHSSFAESPRVIADIRMQLSGSSPEARGLQRIQRRSLGYWLLRDCANLPGSSCATAVAVP